MSSVLALKVTPKTAIFLFLILLFIIFNTLLVNKIFRFWFDFITDLTIERLDLNFSAIETRPFVSFGKQDPPYAGPALKNLLPIRASEPIPTDISSILISAASHKFAISFIYVIFVAKNALDAYLISSAPFLDEQKNLAPFFY